MNTSKLGKLALLAVLVGLVAYASYSMGAKVSTLGGGQPIEIKPSIGSNTSTTVSGTPVQTILTANSAVQRRRCTNIGAFDATISAATSGLGIGNGYVLRASSSFTESGDALWPGAYYAVAVGTTTISCEQI